MSAAARPPDASAGGPRTFRHGDTELAYRQLGAPGAPPLLLVHNAASTFQNTFRRVIAPLAGRFGLVGPDLPGHGRSTNPSGRLDLRRIADDLSALLDHLGIARAHVLAFSGGASAALYLVARHPHRVASQVLIGSHYTVRGLRTRGDAFWDPERIRRDQRAWWDAMLILHGTRARVEAMLRGWQEEDRHRPDFTEAELRAITAPTLLVVGADDPITPVEQTRQMAAWMPDARLVEFPATGHDVIRERREEFLNAAFAFWDRIGAGG